MQINFSELSDKLKIVDESNTDKKISQIVEFIKDRYGNLSVNECEVLFERVPKIKKLFGDYLNQHSSLYNDTKEIKDVVLKNLVDHYIYLKGLEEAKKLGINVEGDFSNTDDLLSTTSKYNSADLYIKSLNYPVLSREEEQELGEKMKNGDMTARNRLI